MAWERTHAHTPIRTFAHTHTHGTEPLPLVTYRNSHRTLRCLPSAGHDQPPRCTTLCNIVAPPRESSMADAARRAIGVRGVAPRFGLQKLHFPVHADAGGTSTLAQARYIKTAFCPSASCAYLFFSSLPSCLHTSRCNYHGLKREDRRGVAGESCDSARHI